MSGHDDPEADLSAALAQMIGALRILDEAGAPGDIGSHLDLAIARLEERLGVIGRQPEPADLLLIRLAAGFDAAAEGRMRPARAWDMPSE
jgi:hypothetical protein